jgi:hypothetical protein
VNNKRFSDSLLKAESKAELNQIFSDIEKSDEDGVKGILLNIFFKKKSNF